MKPETMAHVRKPDSATSNNYSFERS